MRGMKAQPKSLIRPRELVTYIWVFTASKNGQCNPLKRKADQAVDGSPKSAGAAPGAAGDKKSKMGDGESDDIGDGIEEIGEDDEDEDDDETDAERLQV